MNRFGQYAWPIVLTTLLTALLAGAIAIFLRLFSDNATLTLYLRVLAVTGGLGGVISGFIRNERRLVLCAYPANGDRSIECGALADVVIGIGGAWGVFFVLGRSMRIGDETEDLLTLVGLGVVAGFSARSLLATLRTRILGEARTVAAETARETVRDQVQKTTAYSDISGVAVVVQISDASVDPRAKLRLLKDAETRITEVLAKEPANPSAHILLGSIKKRLAPLAETTDEKNRLLGDAINAATRVIELKPTIDTGYYNRACYKALKGESVATIVSDIDKAIELLPENRALLHDDPDLANYRELPEIAARLK